MIHDIKEADLSLLQRFYDMANCADASYARGLKSICKRKKQKRSVL